MLLRLFGIYSSTYFEVFAVQLKFLLALLLQQSKEVLNCKTTYREARLRDKVMGRLQDIAGMHVVMVGIAILHVTILNMMQHGFQHARGNLEQKNFKNHQKLPGPIFIGKFNHLSFKGDGAMSLSFIEQRGHHLLHLEAVREEPLRLQRLQLQQQFLLDLRLLLNFLYCMSADQSWMGRSKIYQVGIGNKGHQKGLNWPSWKVYLVLVQASMSCQQFVGQVPQWLMFTDAVESESIEIPVVHTLEVPNESLDFQGCFQEGK